MYYDSREDSMEAEAKDTAPIKIYTDGSGYQGGASAAAVLYTDRATHPSGVCRHHLGTLKEHSTYEGEAVGLILAAWLLHTHCKDRVGNGSDISIYSDCQSALNTAYVMKPGPGQYLFSAFHDLIAPFKNQGNTSPKFTFHWISAHTNVPGNEKVDKEAKSAALGDSTPIPFLPPILRCPLPIGKSALLQKAKEQRTEHWKMIWSTSPRRKRLKKINKELPLKNFGKIVNELTRRQASILVQIRTGHFPLNDYLHKRKLTPLPLCRACNEHQRETITHLIKDCPAYRKQRLALKQANRGRSLADPISLLSNPKRAKAIIQFIESTKRWTTGHMADSLTRN